MNIHNKGSLRDFWIKHSQSKRPLEFWYADVLSKDWKRPADVKKDYASASIIGNNRIVFNIKGNDFRLILEFNYQKGWAFVKFIGTHAEYDRVDAEQVNMFTKKSK